MSRKIIPGGKKERKMLSDHKHRRENVWVVRWTTTDYSIEFKPKKKHSKTFTESAFDAMTDFMAAKIEEVGIKRVSLDLLTPLGYKIRGTTMRSRSYRKPSAPIAVAKSLRAEDFGGFAQLC